MERLIVERQADNQSTPSTKVFSSQILAIRRHPVAGKSRAIITRKPVKMPQYLSFFQVWLGKL
jgi:hypothetical protein